MESYDITKDDFKIINKQEVQKYEIENIQYSDILKKYRKFITLSSKIIDELSLPKNEISMAFIIGRIINMGYFSYDEEFEKVPKKDKITSKLGISIVQGKGCCRHISSFTSDILKRLDCNYNLFYCAFNDENIRGNASHVVNIIDYNGNLYLYDVSNDFFFNFKTMDCAVDIENKKNKIYYRPLFHAKYERLEYEDIKSKLEMFKKSIESPINKLEYKEIKDESDNNIVRNIELIRDFSRDTKELKKDIHSFT